MQKDDLVILLIKSCYQELQRESLDYKRQATDDYWRFFLLLLKVSGISTQELFGRRSSMTPKEVELILKQYVLMQRTNSVKLLKFIKKELNIRLKSQHQLLWKKTKEELGSPLSEQWSDFFFQAMWAATSILQNVSDIGLGEEQLVVLLLNVKLYMLVFEQMQVLVDSVADKMQFLINTVVLPESKKAIQQQLKLHQTRLQRVVTLKRHEPCSHVLPLNSAYLGFPR